MNISQKLSILLLTCFFFAACGGSATSSDAKTTSTQAASKAGSGDTTEFQETVQQFRALVPKAVSSDFVFYTDFGSASSGVQDLEQLKNFGQFITGRPGKNPNGCEFEGAAVLFDNDGNILAEMDYVLNPACSNVRLRMDGAYSLHEFSPQGIAYFTQFMNVIKGMNQPPSAPK